LPARFPPTLAFNCCAGFAPGIAPITAAIASGLASVYLLYGLRSGLSPRADLGLRLRPSARPFMQQSAQPHDSVMYRRMARERALKETLWHALRQVLRNFGVALLFALIVLRLYPRDLVEVLGPTCASALEWVDDKRRRHSAQRPLEWRFRPRDTFERSDQPERIPRSPAADNRPSRSSSAPEHTCR